MPSFSMRTITGGAKESYFTGFICTVVEFQKMVGEAPPKTGR